MRKKYKIKRNMFLYLLISPFKEKTIVFLSFFISAFWDFISNVFIKLPELNKDENWKEAILILVITAFIFQLGDMFTAWLSARHNNKAIRSMKIDTTILKFGTVIFGAIFLFLFISIFGVNRITKTVTYGTFLVYILREFQSIGENLASRYDGKKFLFFAVLDNFIDIINKYIFDSIGKLLKANKKGNDDR